MAPEGKKCTGCFREQDVVRTTTHHASVQIYGMLLHVQRSDAESGAGKLDRLPSVERVQGVPHLQALLIGQDALQQCGLPRAQKAREHCDRQLLANTCAAIGMHQPRNSKDFESQRQLYSSAKCEDTSKLRDTSRPELNVLVALIPE